MKIKKFEGFKRKNKYKIGDFIFLDDEEKWTIEPICEIIDIDIDSRNRYRISTYYLKKFSNPDDDIVYFWIEENEIKRKITPEEIENYKISKISKKYNL
jgi:hypothetical protein